MFEFLKRLKEFFSVKNKNYVLGKNAESFACKYISKNTPYKILLKNFRHKNHEVDILAFNKETNCLLIIEVKSRAKKALVSGYGAAIKASKMRSVLDCKSAYMKISPHKFNNYTYNIFEVVHDDAGKIVEYFFHEKIPLKHFRR